MKTSRITLLALLAGCSSTPLSNDAAVVSDATPNDALVCAAGQVPGYNEGCTDPAPFCTPDTSGDAVLLTFCGCDGVTFGGSQFPPRRPYARRGSCEGDGGVPPVDAPDAGPRDATLDAFARDALVCAVGQVQGYDQGCASPTPHCAPDTSGDAVVLSFCGCDGTTFTTNQSPPLRPWSHWGACTPDGGGLDAIAVDIPAADAPAPDAPAVDVASCPLPPIDTAFCVRDSDCTNVARGCYCGQQPLVGVARTYAAAAMRCEEEAASRCALGCPIMAGYVAQDGRSPGDSGVVGSRCEVQPSGVGSCRSYVP